MNAHPDKSGVSPTELAVWEFAGLLLTYRCNARCAFCYVHSGPDRAGDMSVATAVRLWGELDRLAAAHGRTMRIHLAGGEPFGDWLRLAAIVRAARDAGLTPLEKVETNAAWATDEHLTRSRLQVLDALGMQKLVVSTDVYHQEFVPMERVRRCVQVAQHVLGHRRVRVRWWDFLEHPVDLRRASTEEKRRAYQAALARHRDRLTGRAAECLAEFLPRYPAEHYRGDPCAQPVLRSRHVHIDGYGHIFPGVCNGIILGTASPSLGVDHVWRHVHSHWRQNPVVEALVTGGSYELMQRARAFGYAELPGGYADKCHLCTHVRQFFVDRCIWPDYLGPRDCYARSVAARALPEHAQPAGPAAPAGEPARRPRTWLAARLPFLPSLAVLVAGLALPGPWGLLFLLVAVGSALAMSVLIWRRAVRRAGAWRRLQCAQCGYDLRGSPTGVCPECGQPARALSGIQHTLPLLTSRLREGR